VEREALRSAINHGGGYILVTEQFLNGAYVGARFEQMGGEAMSKGMRRSRFGDPRLLCGGFNRTLQKTFMHMMTANDA
jgi:hypothetical protein